MTDQERIHQLEDDETAHAPQVAQLMWIEDLLAGRSVNAFALSFPTVRAVADLLMPPRR